MKDQKIEIVRSTIKEEPQEIESTIKFKDLYQDNPQVSLRALYLSENN